MTQSRSNFDIKDYLSKINDWQCKIVKINDDGRQELNTYHNNGILSAKIQELSSFAVFVNPGIAKANPVTFKLENNYPNPFNPTTTIPLEIPEELFVKVTIYNIVGKEVITLFEGIQSPGYHNIQWNGNNQFGQQVSSGIYFIKVQYNKRTFTNKMMSLK